MESGLGWEITEKSSVSLREKGEVLKEQCCQRKKEVICLLHEEEPRLNVRSVSTWGGGGFRLPARAD